MALDTTQIKSNIDSELPSSPPGAVRGLGASRLRTALKYIIDWIAANLFNPKGAWAPGTAYAVNEIITRGGSTYRVTTAFTSGSSFNTVNLELLAGQGWSPVFAAIVSGSRVVRKLVGWTGGAGVAPGITSGGLDMYESSTGFTTEISEATDIRGAQGYAGWTVILANVADGARVVQKVLDMIGGTGTKPSVTGDGGAILYLGAAGFTTDISQATDIRGPIGFNWRGDYAENANYAIGDAFVFRGSTYRVNAAFTAALPFVRTNVTRILRGTWPVGDWVANTQYYEDDIVYNSGSTYRRLVDGLSGATFTGIGTNWGNWSPKGDPGTLTASAFPDSTTFDEANDNIAFQNGTTLKRIKRSKLLDISSLGLPAVRPTLMMDFANSRFVSPRVAHVRSGANAARYNALRKLETIGANIPRIDYNRATGKCLGLLAEIGATNYNAYSVVPSQWASSNATKTDNVVLAPDGSLASTWTNIPNQGSSFMTVNTTGFTAANNATYTYSYHVYVVSATTNTARRVVTELNLGSTNGYASATFDLYNLTVSKSALVSAASIEDVGDGWYRCIVTFTTDAAGTAGIIRNYIGAYGSTPETVTIAAWGSQLEPRDYVTSLVPTTGTAAGVRNIESSKIITDASWFNAKEGTIIIDALIPATATNPNFGIISLTGVGNIADRIDLRSSNFLVSVGGVGQTVPGSPGTTAGILNRYGLTYKAGKTSVCRNGGTVSSAATGSIPVVTNFLLGGVDGGAANNRIWIARFEYYPVQFSDSQLTAATVI